MKPFIYKTVAYFAAGIAIGVIAEGPWNSVSFLHALGVYAIGILIGGVTSEC